MPQRSRYLKNVRIVVTEGEKEHQSPSELNSSEQSNQTDQQNQENVLEESGANIASENDYVTLIDNGGTRAKRKRGRTTCKDIWNNLKEGERIFVEVDKYGQPPTNEGKMLGSFLGTLVTKGRFAPISIKTWKEDEFDVYKKRMLSVIEGKFSYEKRLENWIMKSLNKKWRGYKSELKLQNFDPTKTKDEISRKPPKGVIEDQWCVLVNRWFSEEHQKMCEKNMTNANVNKCSTTMGRTSYAQKRREMTIKNGKEPDRLTLYEEARKKKDGSYVDENTQKKMELVEKLRAERCTNAMEEDIKIINEQIFREVIGDEHSGRVCATGLGPTPRSFFGRGSHDHEASTSFSSNSKEVQKLQIKCSYLESSLVAVKNFLAEKFPGVEWPIGQQDASVNDKGSANVDIPTVQSPQTSDDL